MCTDIFFQKQVLQSHVSQNFCDRKFNNLPQKSCGQPFFSCSLLKIKIASDQNKFYADSQNEPKSRYYDHLFLGITEMTQQNINRMICLIFQLLLSSKKCLWIDVNLVNFTHKKCAIYNYFQDFLVENINNMITKTEQCVLVSTHSVFG